MFLKRLKQILRRPTLKCFQVMLPIVFIVITNFHDRLPPLSHGSGHPLVLNLTMFDDKTTVVYGVRHAAHTLAVQLSDTYKSQFKGSHHELVYVNGSVNDYLASIANEKRYTYTHGYIVAALFESISADEVKCTALYNYEAYHTAPISLNLVDNALLKHYVGRRYSIETTNNIISSPLIRTTVHPEARYIFKQKHYSKGALAGLKVAVSISLVFFGVDMISERASGSKFLQVLSGLHIATFWLTSFIVDFVFYLIPVTTAMYITLAVYQLETFTTVFGIQYSLPLFMAYGWAILAIAYVASVTFTRTHLGITCLIIYTAVSGEHIFIPIMYTFMIKHHINGVILIGL